MACGSVTGLSLISIIDRYLGHKTLSACELIICCLYTCGDFKVDYFPLNHCNNHWYLIIWQSSQEQN